MNNRMDKKKAWMIIAIIVIIALLLLFFVNQFVGHAIIGGIIPQQQENYVEINWEEMVVENVLSQQIAIATECIGEINEENCNWQYTDLDKNIRSYNDYDIEPALKFYKVIVTTIGGEGGGTASCVPKCSSSCGMMQAFGWTDSCTGECIKTGKECSPENTGQEAYCCFIDSDSQGWYSLSCDELSKLGGAGSVVSGSITDYLIKYDGVCHLPTEECTQESDVYVKFTQQLKKSNSILKPNINWIINYIPEIKDSPIIIKGSKDLLDAYATLFDYIAFWNPTEQKQYGAAHGWLNRILLPDYVVTGPFDMEQGKPYFISTKFEDDITWLGVMPEKVEFDFKYVPGTFSENYVVLPFNTEIKKASQLCDIRDKNGNQIIAQETIIGWWDPSTQKLIRDINLATCAEIYLADFDLEPGKVYLIDAQRNAIWQQQ